LDKAVNNKIVRTGENSMPLHYLRSKHKPKSMITSQKILSDKINSRIKTRQNLENKSDNEADKHFDLTGKISLYYSTTSNTPGSRPSHNNGPIYDAELTGSFAQTKTGPGLIAKGFANYKLASGELNPDNDNNCDIYPEVAGYQEFWGGGDITGEGVGGEDELVYVALPYDDEYQSSRRGGTGFTDAAVTVNITDNVSVTGDFLSTMRRDGTEIVAKAPKLQDIGMQPSTLFTISPESRNTFFEEWDGGLGSSRGLTVEGKNLKVLNNGLVSVGFNEDDTVSAGIAIPFSNGNYTFNAEFDERNATKRNLAYMWDFTPGGDGTVNADGTANADTISYENFAEDPGAALSELAPHGPRSTRDNSRFSVGIKRESSITSFGVNICRNFNINSYRGNLSTSFKDRRFNLTVLLHDHRDESIFLTADNIFRGTLSLAAFGEIPTDVPGYVGLYRSAKAREAYQILTWTVVPGNGPVSLTLGITNEVNAGYEEEYYPIFKMCLRF